MLLHVVLPTFPHTAVAFCEVLPHSVTYIHPADCSKQILQSNGYPNESSPEQIQSILKITI